MDKMKHIEIQRKYSLLMAIFLITLPVLLAFGTNDFLDGLYINCVFEYFLSALIFFYIITLKKKKTANRIKWSSRFTLILFWCIIIISCLIKKNHLGVFLWSFPFPLLCFFLLDEKEGLIWTCIFYIIIILIIYSSVSPMANLPAGQKLRMVVTFFMVCFLSYVYEKTRKQAQLKFVQANEVLKQTQQQLVQTAKLASIGELAAGVAHELNQPLMLISGTSQLILRNINKNRYDLNLLEEDLNTIINNSKRMTLIINHLRTFSRQDEKNFLPVDVNTVVNNCLLMIGEQLKFHNIQITTKFSSGLPEIKGRFNQLEQVFLNLLSNARDTIDQKLKLESGMTGEIKIVTRTAHKTEGEIEILITDTGLGIVENNIESIFDPFFTTKEVGEGTGLGLSISYGIIQEHHGTIDVYQTGPNGTTFRVRLPVTGL